jgi:hypothetical protein
MGKGSLQIALGGLALFATLFVLPSSLYDVVSGDATGGGMSLFFLGLALLASGLVLVAVGLIKRSRDLRTARTYASREPSLPSADRPQNPYAPNSTPTQYEAGSHPTQ